MKNKISIIDRLTHVYIKKIKRWMFCPACEGKLNGKLKISKDGKLWKCNKCDYSLLDSEFADNYIFWFCDECKVFLNNQEGFNINASHWVCKNCGFDNDITENNLIGICADCACDLDDPNAILCEKCKTNRLRNAKEKVDSASQVIDSINSRINEKR